MQLSARSSPVAALVVVAAIGWAVPARADDAFVAKTQVYVDNDHTTVVSPLAAIRRDAWQGGTLSASYVADVVSSASVDVISNATKHMTDFRSEITAGLSQKLKATTLDAGYVYSVEHDYSSHNVSLGLQQDLFDKSSTLGVGYTFAYNAVGRTGDQSFHRSLLVNGVGASWTQVFDQRTIGQLSYSFSYLRGYQASPYRFVRVEAPDSDEIQLKVPETEPGDRFRHAFVVGLNRHLFSDSALQADYRVYFDSWGITSHTIQVRYLITWRDVTLRLRERFYIQSAADFYRAHYTAETLSPYVTADRELSSFWSNLVGAKVSWRLPWVHRALEAEVKADFFYFDYKNFPLLAYRVGADLGVGLNVVY